jgi:GNAT superfamily N-acetyltransferase
MDVRILQAGDEALLAQAAKVGDADPRGDADRDPSPSRCRDLLTDPCFVGVVALDAGRPVGFIYGHVLPQMTRTALLIYSVDTDAAHRRRGAARAMIEALRRLSIERGYYEMWVLTSAANEPAMRLYEGSGGVRETFDDVMWVFPLPPR